MRAKDIITELKHEEATLDSELSSVGDDFIFEMANLPSNYTGIDGVIFISTQMGSHGPRVKYYLKAGRHQPSFSVSISDDPQVVSNSLPTRVVQQAAPKVIQWVSSNKDALLTFWNDGENWIHDDVQAFISALVPYKD
jgi:hypothetical protein